MRHRLCLLSAVVVVSPGLVFCTGAAVGGTLQIVRSIPLPYGTMVGYDLAWDGRSLWTSVLSGVHPLSGDGSGFKTYALDPVDGAIVSSLTLAGVPNASGHAWDGDGLWTTSSLTDLEGTPPDTAPDYVNKHSPGGSLIATWPAPHGPDAMPRGAAWDGTHLWISDSRHDEIFEVAPGQGKVITSFPSPGTAPLGLAWDGSSLWVVDGLDDVIYQLDNSGGIIETWSVPIKHPHGLTFDGQYFWILDNYSSKVFAVAVPEPCALVLSLMAACGVLPFVGARLIRAAQTVRRRARWQSSRFRNHA